MSKRRTIVNIAVIVFCSFLALHAVSVLAPGVTAFSPVTLESIALYGVDGLPKIGFVAGHDMIVHFQVTNPNPVAIPASFTLTVQRKPILLEGEPIIWQEQFTVMIPPGTSELTHSCTIPPDAMLGRYKATLTHNGAGYWRLFWVV